MEKFLKLVKAYNKENHLEVIEELKTEFNYKDLVLIYNSEWENNSDSVPYEVLTQIMDSYYSLPERPDLASLFGWQAINHMYNEYLLADPTCNRLKDDSGLKKMIEHIRNSTVDYTKYLLPYYEHITAKTYHFVASYILKGNAILKALGDDKQKYVSSSYGSFKNNFDTLFKVIQNSYGKAYEAITNPVVQGNTVKLQISDAGKSQQIIYSLGIKLSELMKTGTTTITLKDADSTIETVNFTAEDKLKFLVRGILYASRCNNFHGNVASRLNSRYADKESYKEYVNIFLAEYMLLGILFHEQGLITQTALDALDANQKLLF